MSLGSGIKTSVCNWTSLPPKIFGAKNADFNFAILRLYCKMSPKCKSDKKAELMQRRPRERRDATYI